MHVRTRKRALPRPFPSFGLSAQALDLLPLTTRRLHRSLEELLDFLGAVPAVATQRPDGRQLASLRPASHRLGVNPEQRGDFGGREERIVVLRLHLASNVLDSNRRFRSPAS